jgi:subtilisin family serine protease
MMIDATCGFARTGIGSLASMFMLLACSMPVAFSQQKNYVEGEVLAIFKNNVEINTAKRSLGRSAMEMKEHFGEVSRRRGRVSGLVRAPLMTTAAMIKALQADPDVELVEPNYLRYVSVVTPNDTSFPSQWSLQNTGQNAGTSGADVQFLQAWAMARRTTSEVVVAVVDTGMDITHPDLAANVWTNPAEIPGNLIDDDNNGYVDDVHGYDVLNNTASVVDSGSHGTHVAGTIAAVGRNSLGVIGVQYRAKVVPVKVSSDGTNIPTSAVISAFNYVLKLKQAGANLAAINASFASSTYSNSEVAAITALRDAGIVLCVAAGNATSNNNITPSYPASYTTSNIISVASIDNKNLLSSFSNYGATSVDIGAPGSDILSTRPLVDVTATAAVAVNSVNYVTAPLTFSGITGPAGLTKPIYNCGYGYPADFPPAVRGNIALIQRGNSTAVSFTFASKVTNAMNAGAVAALIYDNTGSAVNATPAWTLGTSGNWIPALRITQASGTSILANALPASTTLSVNRDPSLAYQSLSGTSMATPHVTGAVALAAMNFPTENMSQRIARILGNVTTLPALAGKTTTGGSLSLLKIIDTDNDKLPDWWETEKFSNLTKTGSADEDNDGYSNEAEYYAETNPVNSSSYLAVAGLSRGIGAQSGDFIISFPTVIDRTYQVEWSNNTSGNTWQPLGNAFTGTGATVQATDSGAFAASSRRFYRLLLKYP